MAVSNFEGLRYFDMAPVTPVCYWYGGLEGLGGWDFFLEFKFCLCRVIKRNFCVGVLVKNLPSIFLYCIGRKKPGMKFLVLLVGEIYGISQFLYHTGDKRELFAWIYDYIGTIHFPIFHFINFFLVTVPWIGLITGAGAGAGVNTSTNTSTQCYTCYSSSSFWN